MHTFNVRSVVQALPIGVDWLIDHGQREESRAGPVLVSPTPITTIYNYPRYRVLLSPVRDANPFFHLAEAMWMLNGQSEASFLNRFVRDFGERFADSVTGEVHGAYGYRWRTHFGFDQLLEIVRILKNDPTSRQAVLQMWDCDNANDLMGAWKDRPCNTHVYFRVRDRLLDMTVCCRSNDIIWGAYGANAVHFSFLQEYLAARIGIGIGRYYQISNNYHAYVNMIEILQDRSKHSMLINSLHDPRIFEPDPLVDDPETFDQDLEYVLASFMNGTDIYMEDEITNTFLITTLLPMLNAHTAFKKGHPGTALSILQMCNSRDWATAGKEWIERRMK